MGWPAQLDASNYVKNQIKPIFLALIEGFYGYAIARNTIAESPKRTANPYRATHFMVCAKDIEIIQRTVKFPFSDMGFSFGCGKYKALYYNRFQINPSHNNVLQTCEPVPDPQEKATNRLPIE